MSLWGKIKSLFGSGQSTAVAEPPRFPTSSEPVEDDGEFDAQDIDFELLEAEYADALEEIEEDQSDSHFGIERIQERVRGLRVPFPKDYQPTSSERAFMRAVRSKVDEGRYSLPLLRHTTLQVLDIIADPAADVSELTRLISSDQVLTARTLKMANSALLGGVEETTDLRLAIVRTGMRRLKSMMMFVSAQAVILQGKGIGVTATRLWEHSLGAAIFARGLARLLRLDEEKMFVAGLLHDIGKVVILELAREVSVRMKNFMPSEFILTGLFDVFHERIGGQITREWKLPEEIIAVVEDHHQEEPEGPHRQMVAAVSMANEMCRRIVDMPALIHHPSFETSGLNKIPVESFVQGTVQMVCEISDRLREL